MELRRRNVERKRDVAAELEPGVGDCRGDQIKRIAVARQVGSEPALVADTGRQTAGLQHGLQRVVGLRAPLERLGERAGADRSDHELLDVDVGVSVRPAVEDVQHRYGQQVCRRPADVPEERQLDRLGGRPRDGERHTEHGVRTEVALVVRAVHVDHQLIHKPLLGRIQVDQPGADLLEHRIHGTLDALAPIARLAVVPELDRLERPGRRTAGNGGAPDRAVLEEDLALDGRIAARVEDLAGADALDVRHGQTPRWKPDGRCGLACSPCQDVRRQARRA